MRTATVNIGDSEATLRIDKGLYMRSVYVHIHAQIRMVAPVQSI